MAGSWSVSRERKEETVKAQAATQGGVWKKTADLRPRVAREFCRRERGGRGGKMGDVWDEGLGRSLDESLDRSFMDALEAPSVEESLEVMSLEDKSIGKSVVDSSIDLSIVISLIDLSIVISLIDSPLDKSLIDSPLDKSLIDSPLDISLIDFPLDKSLLPNSPLSTHTHSKSPTRRNNPYSRSTTCMKLRSSAYATKLPLHPTLPHKHVALANSSLLSLTHA